MSMIKVFDKRLKIERTVTHYAYAALGPKVYQKIGVVNDDGTEVASIQSPNQKTQVKETKGAEPVVVEAPKLDRNPLDVPPKIETQFTPTPEKVKGKPGRKKTISSSSQGEGK